MVPPILDALNTLFCLMGYSSADYIPWTFLSLVYITKVYRQNQILQVVEPIILNYEMVYISPFMIQFLFTRSMKLFQRKIQLIQAHKWVDTEEIVICNFLNVVQIFLLSASLFLCTWAPITKGNSIAVRLTESCLCSHISTSITIWCP